MHKPLVLTGSLAVAVALAAACSAEPAQIQNTSTATTTPAAFEAKGVVVYAAETERPMSTPTVSDCLARLDEHISEAGQIIIYGPTGAILGPASADQASVAIDDTKSVPGVASCSANWSLPGVPRETAYKICSGGNSVIVTADQLASGHVTTVLSYNYVYWKGSARSGCTGGAPN